MESRRSFVMSLGVVGGGVALSGLAGARRLFATELESVPPLAHAGREVTALRERYLLDPDILYFNHASIGTIPRVVHEARALSRSVREQPVTLHVGWCMGGAA